MFSNDDLKLVSGELLLLGVSVVVSTGRFLCGCLGGEGILCFGSTFPLMIISMNPYWCHSVPIGMCVETSQEVTTGIFYLLKPVRKP